MSKISYIHTEPLPEDDGVDILRLQLAMHLLSQVVEHEARTTAERLGFGHLATPEAPSNYDALRSAFRHSWQTSEPLPVSNLHSSLTIYDRPDTNLALRFWHDVSHVELGCDFTAPQEIELAQYHLRVLNMRHDLGPSSLPAQLLYADLAGQTYCNAVLGYFPTNQLTFCLDWVTRGMDVAIQRQANQPRVAA